MTYSETIRFLDSFQNYEQITAYRYPEAFSLDRVERLLAALGDPHRRYRVLHVAGTKGKGSTCAFAGSILSAAGFKTGLYTSPHLFSFRERIQVDGVPVSEEQVLQAVELLRPFSGADLTYFEVATACAFLCFERAGVSAAVVEVGMGGRLDATNVAAPEVTAITPVSLDHVPKLGNTLAEIAGEKAGILKKGVPAVIAPQPPEVMEVIEKTTGLRGAELHRLDREVRIEAQEITPSGSRADITTPVRRYAGLEVPLLGRHQLVNAAVAIRMAELLAVEERAIREGIAAARWPGRCQLIPGSPPVLLDGAQNAESARAFKAAVMELFPGRKVALVVGASQEKDLEGMARVWGPWAERIFLTQARAPRAEPARRVMKAFAPFHSSPMGTHSIEEALEKAVQAAGPEGLVAVSGSLFVVAEALEALRASPVSGGAGRETGRLPAMQIRRG